jgi:hypothetical protein
MPDPTPHSLGKPGSAIEVLSPKEKAALEELQVNAREGVLYFLSTCSVTDTAYNTFTEGTALAKEAMSTGKEIAKTVKEGSGAFKKQIEDGVGGYLTDMAAEYVPSFGKELVAPALDATKGFINAILPNFIDSVTPYLGDAKQVGSGIYKAGTNFWNNVQLKRADYLARLNQGHPTLIAQAIYDQIFTEGLKGLLDLAYGSAKIIANAVTSGAAAAVTKVIDLVAGILVAIYRFFKRFIDRLQLQKVFASAGELRKSGLARHPGAFNQIFAGWIKDLPILSCYCMNMKITGGYMGFLSYSAAGGGVISQSDFDAGIKVMQRLKNNSAKFIREYEIELYSRDPVVTALMKKAETEDIDDDIASGAMFGFYQKKWILEQKFKASAVGKKVESAKEFVSNTKEAIETAAKARFNSLWKSISSRPS